MIETDGTTTHGRFDGVIDEARVWDHARTGPEILADKNNELTTGTGLVARWGLNEGSNTAVGDSMSSPADGTITGTGYSWVPGFVPPVVLSGNTGIQLTTSSYVTFGDPDKLDLSQFTIETWFKKTGAGTPNTTGTGGATILPLLTHGAPQGEGSSIDANWILGLRSDGTNPIVVAADFEGKDDPGTTGQNTPIVGTTPIADNEWHHAAATFDGTTFAVYLDGNLEASVDPGFHPRDDSAQGVGLGTMIETDGTTTHGRFDGVIDEARVWDHARTGPEILADKNNELTTGTGLVARWGLNEGSNTAVGDSMSSPADGTITGTGYSWVPGFVPPTNAAPDAPSLNSPEDADDQITTSPTLDIGVSDPDGDALTVTFYGRPLASGNFSQIGQNTGVPSGTTDTTTTWLNLGSGQTYEWYATVSDGSLTTTGPTWTFHTIPSTDPVFVGVGDIATCDVTTDSATGDVIKGIDGTVFTTGDNVYPYWSCVRLLQLLCHDTVGRLGRPVSNPSDRGQP